MTLHLNASKALFPKLTVHSDAGLGQTGKSGVCGWGHGYYLPLTAAVLQQGRKSEENFTI